VDPENPDAKPRDIGIYWLGGCFDPVADQYYACYDQLLAAYRKFTDITDIKDLPDGVGFGPTFTLKIPDDIVTRREQPQNGPYYGLAYVFFLACPGTPGLVSAEGTGRAGSFPVGCFDADGKRLGPDSFVAGYTQVYVFDDGRTNANPPIQALNLDHKAIDAE